MKYLLCLVILIGIFCVSEEFIDFINQEQIKKREATTTAILEKCRETELVRYEYYSFGYYTNDYMLIFSDGNKIPLYRQYNLKQANKMLKKCFEHKTKSEAEALYEKFKIRNLSF